MKRFEGITFIVNGLDDEKNIDVYVEYFNEDKTPARDYIGGCKWRREKKFDSIIWLKGIHIQHSPNNYQRQGLGSRMIDILKHVEHFDDTRDKILCHVVPTPPTTKEEAYRFYASNGVYVGDLTGVSSKEDIERFRIPEKE